MKMVDRSLLLLGAVLVGFGWPRLATADITPPAGGHQVADEMEVQIKGQFRGRLLVDKVPAPVTLNLEKLQNFPEDPSQRILLDPINISESTDFNARPEIKGYFDFRPWVPMIAEPPFLRMAAPLKATMSAWIFEVLNPQGQVIYRQRGVHELTDDLTWDGKDSEMKFAVVGRLYTAQLTLVDDNGKAKVIQGPSVIMPALAYSTSGPQSMELSLDRIFKSGRAEISPEGQMLLYKIGERISERGLTRLHVRIAEAEEDLASQREQALVHYFHHKLHLTEDQLMHDHNTDISRGSIAVIWAKGVHE